MISGSGLLLLAWLTAASSGPRPVERTLAVATDQICGLSERAREIDCLGALGASTITLPAESRGTIVDLDAEGSTLCARTDGGSMVCWELSARSNTVAERYRREDVLDVAVGNVHRCVVRLDGGVECWGNNDQGQIGDGTRHYRPRPVQVDLPRAVAVEVAGASTCALLADGTVRCWGGNPIWGDETRLKPEPVDDLEGVARILPDHRAVLRDGSLVRWTVRRDGSFGPIEEETASGIDAAGSCFIGSGSEVSCRGATSQSDPIGFSDAVEISSNAEDICARDRDGQVSCWNRSDVSTLELPRVGSSPPARIDGIDGAVEVEVDSSMACARTKAGRVWCWRDVAIEVPLKARAMDISIEQGEACSMTERGPRCWMLGEEPRSRLIQHVRGQDACKPRADGKLGCTSLVIEACETSAVGVSRCESHDLAATLQGVVAIDRSPESGCVVQSDGRVRCWPSGKEEASADGLFDVGIDDIRSVSTGGGTNCGVDGSGRVWCWGERSGPVGAAHRPTKILREPTRLVALDRSP